MSGLLKDSTAKIIHLESGNDYTSENSTLNEENNGEFTSEIIVKTNIDNNKGNGNTMENDKMLEMYISKMDRDQSDLRNDIRASEQRTSEQLRSMESRMDNSLKRIEDIIERQSIKSENDKKDIDAKVEGIKAEIQASASENRKFMWGIVFTIVLGIAAMIVSMCIGIAQIIGANTTTTASNQSTIAVNSPAKVNENL